MFDSAEEALPYAEEIPGPSTEAFERECRRLGVHAICGLLERDGDTLYNAAILVGPDGLIGSLPEDAPALPRRRPLRHAGRRAEGLRHRARPDRPDHLLRPPLPGGDADAGAARRRHRRPADELPDGGEGADRGDHARAARRRTGSTSCARTASARSGRASSAGGARSSTRTASGWPRPGETEEALLVAEVDVEKARDKDYVVPGEYELYLFGHRRPELYGALVEETQAVTDLRRIQMARTTRSSSPTQS